MNINLYNKKDSKKFYEDRYSKGYMEDWPIEKKQKVLEILRSINFPKYGDALDFGCGNGIFTNLLKTALPKWNVYGCDISKKAIINSTNQFSNCTFFNNNNEEYIDKTFDFIFSHHVLEHVFDINDIASQIVRRAKGNSKMLHIFPCGNPNSYEYKICSLRVDGINTNMENRFFFEDEGHIRRMTTEQCSNLFKKYNYILKKDYYTNQYFGALNWITCKNFSFIIMLFNPSKGNSLFSKIILSRMLVSAIMIKILRIPVNYYNRILRYKKSNNKIKYSVFLVLFWCPYILSKYINKYIDWLTLKEWDHYKNKKNGSEMFLFFQK